MEPSSVRHTRLASFHIYDPIVAIAQENWVQKKRYLGYIFPKMSEAVTFVSLVYL